MDYLVAEANPSVRDSLCYALLAFGIKGIPVATRQQAEETLAAAPDLRGAIIDLDSKEIDGEALIRALRENEATAGLNIIAHSVQSGKEMVNRMMDFGVVGYLLKPYSENEIGARLQKILSRGESHNSQRKHIRVRPDPDELLRLHFKLPGHPSLISGKVLDVSLGGVAVELFNPPRPDVLKPQTRIPRIEFTVNRQPFRPPGKVVLFKEQLLALRFDYLTGAERTALSKYVFKRLSA